MTSTPLSPRHSIPDIRLAAAGWLFCAVFFFYAFILRVSPAVMVDDLMREFAVGAAILGNLSAVYLYIYAGLQIPVGLFIDRFGLRYFISGACAVTGIGAIVFALGETLSAAYLGRFLIGAGAAFSFVSALNMAARWFPARFALLGGWAQMLGSAGGFTGQAPLGLAIATFGWRSTNFALGIAGLLLAVLLLVSVRDPAGGRKPVGFSTWRALRIVGSNKQTWLVSISAGGLTGTLLAFGGLWGVPFLMAARGLDKTDAAGLISIGFVGWAIAAPLMGWISDRMGRRRPLIILGTGAATISTGALVLRAEGDALFKAADESGLVLTGGSYDRAIDSIESAVMKGGLDRGVQPKSWAVLQRLIKEKGTPKTLQEITTLRRVAGGAAKSIDPDEARIASMIIDDLDDYLAGVRAGDVVSGRRGGPPGSDRPDIPKRA